MDFVKRADTKLLKTIGNNIRMLRLEQDISQVQLAFEAEMTVRQLGRIERGESNPGFLALYKLAEALDVPIHELIAV
jgi:transcriptional regulator with XRE-family HTH domain